MDKSIYNDFPCMVVERERGGAGTAITRMPVRYLLTLVPDPRQAEKPAMMAADSRFAREASLRNEIQRAVTGAKARNIKPFTEYIVAGAKGERRTWLPPVTLYTSDELPVEEDGSDGFARIGIPHGAVMACIDGETHVCAEHDAVRLYEQRANDLVSVVIHFGYPLSDARQGFHDLNLLGVKPNTSISVAMDNYDNATRWTREVIERGPLAGHVSMIGRQANRKLGEITTLAAMRTAISTTVLGSAGFSVGTKPIAKLEELTSDEADALRRSVLEVWDAILTETADAFTADDSVIASPGVLAAIGALAHHAIPSPPRRPDTELWSPHQVVQRLVSVDWTKGSHWVGIAGKVNPRGTITIHGAKEVGHLVLRALEDPASAEGRQIRHA